MKLNDFDQLKAEVENGMLGHNASIPMGFNRLNDHVGIRKSTNYLIGGYTGSGKTSFVDDAFVLNPIDWWLSKKRNTEVDFHIIYWSMERRKSFKLAKWICRKIFLDKGGMPISLNRVMGWCKPEDRLSNEEFDLFCQYEDYISALQEKVTIIEGPQNPMGVKKFVDNFMRENGEVREIDKYNHVYIPKDPTKIIWMVSDHIGLQKGETRDDVKYRTKKEIIDLSSEDKRRFRDFYGMSCVDISQFNRDIANPLRLKNGDVEPMLEDFKDSGNTQEDADVIMSLFDPFRYKVADPSGYNLDKLRDSQGRKKYRNVKILKNTYGSDDIRIGLAFQPELGLFKEMPKKPKEGDISDKVYSEIIDNTYFIN